MIDDADDKNEDRKINENDFRPPRAKQSEREDIVLDHRTNRK